MPVWHFTSCLDGDLRIGVDQVAGDHRGAHGTTEVGVAAKALNGREADEDGQESKHGRGDQVDHGGIVRNPRCQLDDGLGTKESRCHQNIVE